jgi:hypothetical protein
MLNYLEIFNRQKGAEMAKKAIFTPFATPNQVVYNQSESPALGCCYFCNSLILLDK